MDSELVAAKADHHPGIAGQGAALDSLQSSRPENREQLRCSAGGDVEFETQLCGIRVQPSPGNPILQRLKHFTGPATKFDASSDQSIVDTSISAGVMRMLFTDDGRPPRERFEIVPAVEMIVPFLVCSM